MKLINKKIPGICYSNISLIKRALLQNPENILPYHEIVLYVKKNWMNLNSSSNDIQEIVDLALNAPKSYFYEVEDGLWGIKDKIDARLNHIYEYMNPRKSPLRISDMKYRLKVYEADDVLRQMLLTDIRFSQIENTPYWILSEWVIINNMVYDYILKSDLIDAEKEYVIERVVLTNKLDKEKVIFLPQFDERFSTLGNRIEIKLSEDINDIDQQEIEVPVEISEEVGRLSYKIINFLKESKKEVSTTEIINHVFKVSQNEPSFPIYSEATKDLLEVVPEIKQIDKHKWLYRKEAANLKIVNDETVYYAVKNSTPTIENVSELMEYANQSVTPSSEQVLNRWGNEKKITEDMFYAYHTVSYFDRVKGYFIIPKTLIEQSILFRQNTHGKIMIEHEEYRYEWNWEIRNGKYYFFGDGVMDFFADSLIEPGHKLGFKVDKDIMFLIRVHKVGFDERYATEQQRYLDIGRLIEESKSVNKSIFSLMCETLATHPSGMHWSLLQDKISEKRSTTKNTVTNLLSRNECFKQVEDKKGYWRLNISKLSRYYINEENLEMEEPAETGKDDWMKQVDNEELITESTDDVQPQEEKGQEIIEFQSDEILEIQLLDTESLIQQIENTLIEITQEEKKLSDIISECVLENFNKGDIVAIEELYTSIEPSLNFFNKVKDFVNDRERKSVN
ncbi:hypothetical protein [Fredinandcohnia onubensis]|uniref:hypothetical protein n=1 Tax=Fredinandcohnia onubensis TaxID=1571209 RepID=UPI000C0C0977|nr:hypothetical protein [Fredinandcohnia onubensis]